VPENKLPWIIGVVLIAVLVIGALVVGGGKKKSKGGPTAPPESARALSLPVNRARTVVVPPCNTPVEQTTRSAARGQGTPGATTLGLPRGSGVRFVLVPHCQPKAGVTSAPGNLPSAAFVLPAGERPSEGQGGGFVSGGVNARTQLLLPSGSTASTVVVPPCRKKTDGKRDVIVGAQKAGSHTVVAPSC
jgi:hypothetical protein